MTTANKLTILRVLMIPVMIIILYIEALEKDFGLWGLSIAGFVFAVLFVLASLTDMLDGYIARKYNQITTFGKFLDPIADKVLVLVAMLYLMVLDSSRVGIWAVMIVIMREFLVTGIRLLAVDKGKVIAASPYGKFKTASTMIALVLMLFNDFGFTPWIGNIVFYIAILLTVVSGIDYLIKNKAVVFESM